MRTSSRGMMEIAAHEGIVPMPYKDSVGVWTFGIGHTKAAGDPDPASMPRARTVPLESVFETFRRDLQKYERRVNAAVKVPLKQHEFDALVSFDYNTGGIDRAKLTEHLNAGDRRAAGDAFMGWKKPPEIIPRRRKEQALFRDGTYASHGTALLFDADAAGRVLWQRGRRVDIAAAIEAISQTKPMISDDRPMPRRRRYPFDPEVRRHVIVALIVLALVAFIVLR